MAYSRDQSDILKQLEQSGIIDAISWAASTSAISSIQQFDPEQGHDRAWLGTTRHNQLSDRLDRVFSVNNYALEPEDNQIKSDGSRLVGLPDEARASIPAIEPGLVSRSNLLQSPGWQFEDIRLLIQSAPIDSFESYSWKSKGGVKKRVAEIRHDPVTVSRPIQTSLLLPEVDDDFGESDEVTNLIVMHGLDEVTHNRKLAIGRAHYQEGDSRPWHWLEYLYEGPSGGNKQRLIPPKPARKPTSQPLVRLRKKSAEEKKL